MRFACVPADQNENEGEFKAVLQRAVGTMYTFSCRAKQETFNVRTMLTRTRTACGTLSPRLSLIHI